MIRCAGMEIVTVDTVEEKRTVYYGAGGAFRVIGGEDAGLYFRHTDHLGSTSVISDENGDLVTGSTTVYAPFGEIRYGEQSDLTDFGFTGQQRDSSTGLMYYGSRYYLPELRHFISPDTIVPGMGNPQNLNRYSYVGNNPYNFGDPSGHMRIKEPSIFSSSIKNPFVSSAIKIKSVVNSVKK
jgi:RHS repeat-associated protein